MEFSDRLFEVNQQLESVTIRVRGRKLSIRGTFPPKPGDGNKPKSYEISTGCSATPAGLRIAKEKAREIDSLLIRERFDWRPYLKGKAKPAETVLEWVERYEADHWQKTPHTSTKENSFHKNYRLYFQRMPQDELLTIDLLKHTITKESKPATRNREFFCMAYGKLAGFMVKQGEIATDD